MPKQNARPKHRAPGGDPTHRPRKAIRAAIRAAAIVAAAELLEARRAIDPQNVAQQVGVTVDDLKRSSVDLASIQKAVVRFTENQDRFGGLRSAITRSQLFGIYSRAPWVDKEDIRAAGDSAFVEALCFFEPDRKTTRANTRSKGTHSKKGLPRFQQLEAQFLGFAKLLVRRGMLAQANAAVPRALQQIYRTLAQAEHGLLKEAPRQPTDEEISRISGLSLDQIVEARRAKALFNAEQPPAYEQGQFDGRSDADEETWDVPAGAAADDGGERIGEFEALDEFEARGGVLVPPTVDDRERIERGISGPHLENEREKVDLKALLAGLRDFPRALAEVSWWLEGTWNYLARREAKPPSTAALSAALGVSALTVTAALTRRIPRTVPANDSATLESLFAERTLPPATPGAVERGLLPDEVQEAYDGLSPKQREIIDWKYFGGVEPAAVRGLGDSGIKQSVKRATDRFTERVILNIVEWRLHLGEPDVLVARYRNGQYRLDPPAGELTRYRSVYRRLRRGLEENELLERIFSDRALKVLDSRYRWDKDPAGVSDLIVDGWSVNQALAIEFEKMQDIVSIICPLRGSRVAPRKDLPHQKKLELPHALLPEQLQIACLHFRSGLATDAIGATQGITEQRVNRAMWDVLETQRWLFDDGRLHARYLNMGRYPPVNTDSRKELQMLCDAGGRSPAAAPHVTTDLAKALCATLGFE